MCLWLHTSYFSTGDFFKILILETRLYNTRIFVLFYKAFFEKRIFFLSFLFIFSRLFLKVLFFLSCCVVCASGNVIPFQCLTVHLAGVSVSRETYTLRLYNPCLCLCRRHSNINCSLPSKSTSIKNMTQKSISSAFNIVEHHRRKTGYLLYVYSEL